MTRPFAVLPTCTPARLAGVGAAVLAAGLLGACSGSSSGGAPSTQASTATATTTATATVTTSPASTTAVSTGTAAGSGGAGAGSSEGTSGGSGNGSGGAGTAAYCKEKQLRASIEHTAIPGNGTHGERAVIVDFTNTSNSTCVLYGYPGAAVLNASKQQVTEAKRTIRGRLLGYAPGHDTLVHVTLKPGQVANAGIEGTNQQEQGAAQAGCDADPNPQIEVTPPNTRTPVPFDVTWPICYSFTVHPVNYKN